MMILERLDVSESGATKLAMELGEKIKHAIALSFDPHGVELQCTASIGVRLFGPKAEIENLLKQADQALYEAKRAGRNRVSCFNLTIK